MSILEALEARIKALEDEKVFTKTAIKEMLEMHKIQSESMGKLMESVKILTNTINTISDGRMK